MYSHGQAKYPLSQVVTSSAERDWSGISAELRAHQGIEGKGFSGEQIEIALLIDGDRNGLCTCAFGRQQKPIPTLSGTAWICPPAVVADEIRNTARSLTAVHLYIPSSRLFHLTSDDDLRVRSVAIRSAAIHRDEMINQLCQVVLSEMEHESAGGHLLVDAAANMMTVWLMRHYAESGPAAVLERPRSGLDPTRLRRVIQHIEYHIEDDLTLDDLARVACLSAFHFSRRFAVSMGMPPHRYVSQRRLERAMEMIASGELPLSEIAVRSGFSSQASFSRAFRRTVGLSPGEYRRHLL